jgi:hypothetical protein
VVLPLELRPIDGDDQRTLSKAARPVSEPLDEIGDSLDSPGTGSGLLERKLLVTRHYRAENERGRRPLVRG